MRPTSRCVLLFAAGLPLAALPLLFGAGFWTAWVVWVGVACVLTGVDALLALPGRKLDVKLEAPATLFVGDRAAATVTLQALARSATRRVTVLVDLSELLTPQAEVEAVFGEGQRAEAEIELVPVRRGTAVLERVWIRWTGPLGLMSRQTVRAEELAIPVVPNIHAVRGAALAFAKRQDAASGQRSVRFIGEGSEFDAMREYVPGLDHRSINWRATARHRKLICQDFRAERNHQVITAIDTGHLMAEPLGTMPKLDHAIHSALILAHTCVRNGDRVGLYAFDQGVRQFVAPDSGMRGFRRLQQATAELDYTMAETNFTLGLAELSSRLNRRSLVVLLTDFVDTVTAELMVENAARLARHHLVVFVTLRDAYLEATVNAEPASLGALHRSVVAGDFVRERELVIRRLRRLGIFTIDTTPEGVSTQLLNRYLTIKRRELI